MRWPAGRGADATHLIHFHTGSGLSTLPLDVVDVLGFNRTNTKVPCWGVWSLLRDNRLIPRLLWDLSPPISHEFLEVGTAYSSFLCSQHLAQQKHPVNV